MVEKELPLWSVENKLVLIATILMNYLTKLQKMSEDELIIVIQKERKDTFRNIGVDFGVGIEIDERRMSKTSLLRSDIVFLNPRVSRLLYILRRRIRLRRPKPHLLH